MDNDDLTIRSQRIATVKSIQRQKEEFLKTEYHIPVFESLHIAIKQFEASLRGGGLQYKVYYNTDPDVVDDWARRVWVGCEHLSCGVTYKIGYYLSQSDEGNDPDYGQYEHVRKHIFTFDQFNFLTQEGTENNLELTIGDNLEPLWNGHDNKVVSQAIFLWLIENMEQHYGV
ncbi:hypothetical protein IQ277_28090 [Nostocales cyanobacterium LEGE 12452]|nr:hypothetical protein [Nostocales cyanobacterium LEGE 12452]